MRMGAGRFAYKTARRIARLIVAVVAVLALGPLSASASANLTIEEPSNDNVSNQASPTFAGSTSDVLANVQVNVYPGESVGGSPVRTLTTLVLPVAGTWSLGPTEALADGVYTAQASQAAIESEPELTSNQVTFTVDTAPPTVTLKGPAPLSNETDPTFSGKASDHTEVVVHIFHEGSEVAQATAPTGGSWSSSNESSLGSGTYTAYATEASSLGNEAGKSTPIEFTISTASPNVTLTGPAPLSNVTKPSFSGEASDHTEVVVHIFHEGSEVAEATAPTGGSWSASNESSLGSGTYTAYATQESSLHNPEGRSPTVEFRISTASPRVTLTGPASLSNETKPSFGGEASDHTTVVVHIFNEADGEEQATATPSGGGWGTSNESTLASGSYRAYATQESSLGNEEGMSNEVHFTISTASPRVTLTGPASLSNETKPSFGGEASDHTTVVVHIFNEASQEVTATATPGGGSWGTSNESTLASGSYRAYATQESSLGNKQGVSNEVHFTINTAAPRVTLEAPPTPSDNTRPSFRGEASDTREVTVLIYAGSHASGSPVSSATAKATAASGPRGKRTTPFPMANTPPWHSRKARSGTALGRATR